MSTSIDTPGKKAGVGRDWTQGSIVRNVLLLSWPMMVLGALYSVNMILEMVWVGRLGPASIAGVGVSGFIVLLVISVKNGLGNGDRAMVARYVGSGDIVSANRVAGQAFVISAVYAAFVAVISVLFARPILGLFHLGADTAAEGVLYLRIILAGWMTEAFWMTSFSVMQASGDSMTPLKVAVVIRSVNAVLCPFLVLGLWIFPPLGVRGAAITYITATGLGACLCFWFLFTGHTRLRLSLSDFYPDPKIIWRILKIGIPASVSGLGTSFSDLILTSFMVPFGTVALAAHNLLARIELFINTPGMGLGTGASVLVGQNLGAGQPGRATKSGWTAIVLVLSFMLFCIIALLVWAENIIGLFNAEPDLVRTGVSFLKIAVTGYMCMCIVNIMLNCIAGAGDTVVPMVITLGRLWIVLLPLAYLLSRFTNLGVYGVRWAIVISYVVGAAAYLAYFQGGRWKRKKV
jgi:putative MATE family efflux protein